LSGKRTRNNRLDYQQMIAPTSYFCDRLIE